MHGNLAASESSNIMRYPMKFPFTGLPGLSAALIDRLQRSRLADEQALIHAEATAPQIAAPKGERMATVQAVAVITMVLIALYTGKAHATDYTHVGGIGSDYVASPPVALTASDLELLRPYDKHYDKNWDDVLAPVVVRDNWEIAPFNSPQLMAADRGDQHVRDYYEQTETTGKTPDLSDSDREPLLPPPLPLPRPRTMADVSTVDEIGFICWTRPNEGVCPELLDESLVAATRTQE
jgi:hypothetical protein